MSNNQILNSALVLAGVKGDYALHAAVNEVKTAALHAITDGNTRPFDETKSALTKGVTKEGNFALNNQGVVLAALINSAVSSRKFYEQLHDNNGKLNKKLTAEDKAAAVNFSENIAHDFSVFVVDGLNILKTNRKAAADKTKATKEAAAVETKAAEVKKEAAAAVIAEKIKNDTFVMADFLKAIKGGNIQALDNAALIVEAVNAYNLQQASKAAKIEAYNAKQVKPVKQAIAA